LQWGFYFNAAQDDYGSDDLRRLINNISEEIGRSLDRERNTRIARKMTMVLFLSRIFVLDYCLSIPECEDKFNSKSWALLQTCPYIFHRDVFYGLYQNLNESLQKTIFSENALALVVSEKFISLREKLAEKNYPNFEKRTNLQLVIDEAQIPGDKGLRKFESQLEDSEGNREPRPMLSPILHGIQDVDTSKKLVIIYCGTGLSIRTMEWVISTGGTGKDAIPIDIE
jgi:hypothetical protein